MPRVNKKLSNDIIAKIAEYVEQGLPQDTVAALAGVKVGTLRGWLQRANKDDDPDPLIYKIGWAVSRAHARFVQKNVDNISTAGDSGKWDASRYLLEQRDPKNFGKKNDDADVPVRVIVVPEVSSVEDWMEKHGGKKKEEVEVEES